MALALLAGLTEKHVRAQHFRTRACPAPVEVAGQVTGLPGRHLDSWLMPPDVCRSLFLRGARDAELAVVEGTLDRPLEIQSCTQSDLPGELKQIAEILDLPVIAVLPMPERLGETFHLPHLPDGIDGVLIDRIADPADLPRLRRLIGRAWKLPVLGALEELPTIRRELEQTPRSQFLPEGAVEALAHNFLRHCDLDAIRALAASRPLAGPAEAFCACGLSDCCHCFRVAYAQDEAFGRYFPDTLEALAGPRGRARRVLALTR